MKEEKTVYCGYWTNESAGQRGDKVFETPDLQTAEKLAGNYRTGLVVRKETKEK